MYGKIKEELQKELSQIKDDGIYKSERVITTQQGAEVHVSSGEDVVIMCANNYLGLSSHPEVIQASKEALDIAKDTVKINAKVLWLQLGISSDEAKILVEKNNINYVENRCTKMEYQKIFLKKTQAFPVLINR